ncbi:hypothetical protein ACH4D5_29380 [Streptomyces sp. NPDC018029]|uniref:hypothetical protein n=1 Tax=Streptomyces sp. NPDC018029 TaxID=3365032 RepID=UPI0037961F92
MPHAGSASGLTNTTAQLGQAIGVALSSVVFFDRLGPGGPSAQAEQMPHAFAGSLWYVAGVFMAGFAVLFALPRTVGTTPPAADKATPKQKQKQQHQKQEAEPVPTG